MRPGCTLPCEGRWPVDVVFDKQGEPNVDIRDTQQPHGSVPATGRIRDRAMTLVPHPAKAGAWVSAETSPRRSSPRSRESVGGPSSHATSQPRADSGVDRGDVHAGAQAIHRVPILTFAPSLSSVLRLPYGPRCRFLICRSITTVARCHAPRFFGASSAERQPWPGGGSPRTVFEPPPRRRAPHARRAQDGIGAPALGVHMLPDTDSRMLAAG